MAHHAAAEARALAALGHRVTLLAPASGRERLQAGRDLLRRAASGDAGAVVADPGALLEVATGRALPAGAGRRLGGPLELAQALEAALTATPFDVVHLHEPLAPSPALAGLRHARGAVAATFHRAEPLAGVAFLRPLVDRALARVDLRLVTSAVARRALDEILPGEYLLLPPGVDAVPAAAAEDPPPLVVLARARDRSGLRFGMALLRALDLGRFGRVVVVGPPETPWRTRAAVPKALRDRVTALADPGPEARLHALAGGAVAVVATPEEAAGPGLREAMASGCAVLAPRGPAADELARHGAEALILPPFSRDAWAAAATGLADDRERRRALAEGAARAVAGRTWAVAAAELDDAYRGAVAARRGTRRPAPRLRADLRVRPGERLAPEDAVAAAAARGLAAVAVAAPGGVAAALAAARAAPSGLAVIVGQEVATADGVIVGLFLSRDVRDGTGAEDAAAEIHAQGGLVMVPHPDAAPVPPPEVLRRLGGAVDCLELLTAGLPPAAEEGAELARRLGVRGCAGSGAETPADVGAAVTELRPFHGPADLIEALADARLVRAGGGRRGRRMQPRRGRRGVPRS